MGITFRPIQVETGSEDQDGMLVLDDDRLVAVIVRLSDMHGEQTGGWHVEWAKALSRSPGLFDDLDQVATWLRTLPRARGKGPG